MTTRFAGSRSLDERRRRRLAGGADEGEASLETDWSTEYASTSGESTAAPVVNDDPRLRSGGSSQSRFPVSRLFSRKLWKHWAVSLFSLLLGAGILVGGWAGEAGLGPGFAYLFDLAAGRAARRFCELLMLLSSQLALFIWWARSRSPRDFGGRYRLWAWCALFGFAAAFTSAAELHVAWSKTALWLWDIPLWNREILVWMIPAAVVSAWVLRTLHREMRDCSSSLAMLWTAAVCGLSAALLTLGVRLPDWAPDRLLLHTGLEMAAYWALFVSLLLHTRHVVHVTADPADVRPFPLNLRSLLRWSEFRRAANDDDVSEENSDKMGDRKSATAKSSEKSTNKSTRKKSSKRKTDRAAEEPQPASVTTDDRQDREPTPEPTAGNSSQPAANEPCEQPNSSSSDGSAADRDPIPIDEPIDQETLKGLSKRERRRLRKQRREAQRAERAQRRAG